MGLLEKAVVLEAVVFGCSALFVYVFDPLEVVCAIHSNGKCFGKPLCLN